MVDVKLNPIGKLQGKVSSLNVPLLDKTLTKAGQSADAKAVGDAIKEVNAKLPVETRSRYDLLWENPDMTAEFPSNGAGLTKIELNLDYYDEFRISYKKNNTAEHDEYYVDLRNKMKDEDGNYIKYEGGYTVTISDYALGDGVVCPAFRNISIIDKGIQISSCRIMLTNGTVRQSWSQLIPCRIYGINNRVASDLESVDNLYLVKADAIIDKASGESPLCIRDTVDNMVRNLKLYGKTEQDGTSGKNLLKNIGKTQTINGVTFTVNEDGTVTANGTATADIYHEINATNAVFPSGEKIILNGCPSGGSATTYSLATWNSSWAGMFSEFGNGQEWTVPSDGVIKVRIKIANGATVSNLVFKPMIRLASITDGTYEPYTGGIASPNPDYPQEMWNVMVSEVKTHGKNLLNAKIGTEINGNDQYYLFDVKPNTAYTLTICQEMVAFGTQNKAVHNISYFKEDSTRISYQNMCVLDFASVGQTLSASQTITIPEETSYIRIDLGTYYSASESSTIKTVYAQFEEGSVATEYEPYIENSFILSKPIKLNGIGNAMDELTADGVVRKFGSVVIDGDEYLSYNADEGRVVTATISNIAKKVASNDEMANMMCNAFIAKPYTIASKDKSGIALSTSATLSIFSEDFTSLDAWKAYLAEYPLELLYELAEPITEPLPAADQTALRSLKSYNGVTYLECDSGVSPTMEAEVVIDTKRYIDSKFSELVTALGTNLAEVANLVGGDA